MIPTNLTGRTFGSLKVIKFWGSQSGNRAWAYFCRACGHVGKRLATKLVTGRAIDCPRCDGRRFGGRSFPHKLPDPDRLREVMDMAPAPADRTRRVCVSPTLARCSMIELHGLAARIENEFSNRLKDATP